MSKENKEKEFQIYWSKKNGIENLKNLFTEYKTKLENHSKNTELLKRLYEDGYIS